MKQLLIFAAFLISVFYLACTEKDTATPKAEGEVQIFLLKSFNEKSGTQQIDESSVELEKEAFLNYDDLISYNRKSHTFKIPENKRSLFAINGSTVHFKAFAVLANNELIYTGYFWPEYSSQICDWNVISPIRAEISGDLRVRLGYPGQLIEAGKTDKRNDDRIINIFKRDNKLIE